MKHSTACPSCCKKYVGFGGDDARKPVVLTCLCVFCKACALQEEVKAQQQQPPPAASGGGGKKGKGKKKEKKGEEKAEYIPTPCMSFGKHCKVPVNELKLDVATMKGLDSGGATEEKEVPVCGICAEEQSTHYCKDCAGMHRMLCDGCYIFAHKSAKKQGHASIPIQEHLATTSPSAAGGAAALSKMCAVHIGHPLLLFCDTCNVLICGMCGSFDHAGHVYKEVKEATAAHRAMVEAAVAAVKITRQEAIAATNAIKIIRGELEGNRDAAIKLIEAGFSKLLRAIKQRRDALKKLVNDTYNEKDDVLNQQITELEGIDSHSEIALKLVEATLEAATPVGLLERTQLLVDGLTQFKEHGVSLMANCVPNMTIQLKESFEQSANNILAIGMLDASATDPSASTAAGEGLATARVGKAAECIVTAVEAGTGKQRSVGGDSVLVVLRQAITADEGAAPSGGGGGGGGGGAAAAAKPGKGKRKRGDGGSGSTGKGWVKKSKTGATTSAAARDKTELTVVDNEDGTYSCSYTPSEGAAEVGGGKWQLEVLLNGESIVGSPFAVEVHPSANITNWVFGSVAPGITKLSDGGAVATKIIDDRYGTAIADGAGCTPMTSGIHFWELEVVKNDDDDGAWYFGVCRPGIDLNDDDDEDFVEDFYERADTWLVFQNNDPDWGLRCSTCEGTGMTLYPKPKLFDGSRIGLLLDLDNGGTLTMYWQGKPCGTIAEGLVGPLLPCISSLYEGKVVKIHGGLAPPSPPPPQ
eukprot:gene19815-biopygen7554